MAATLTHGEYPFLKELGIEAENKGAYMGQWLGNGPAITALNPANNKPIAIVHGVCCFLS
jgi:aldehyde dehydrogenase family 7 member A1